MKATKAAAEIMVDRIAELEAELRERDEKIKRLTDDLGEAQDLVGKMREQAEDHGRLLESWIDVFDMQQDDNGRGCLIPRTRAYGKPTMICLRGIGSS
jgi:hypothetical protein